MPCRSPTKVAKMPVKPPTPVAERLANSRVNVVERPVSQRQKSYSSSPPRRPDRDEFRLRADHISSTANIEASGRSSPTNESYLRLSEDQFDFPLPPQSPGSIQTITVTVQNEQI
jgi:hypothetical protein